MPSLLLSPLRTLAALLVLLGFIAILATCTLIAAVVDFLERHRRS